MSKAIQVELLSDGGFSKSIENCIGKVFTTVSTSNSNGNVRIPVEQLVAAGYTGGATVPSLVFFDWEVRILDDS